MPHMQLQVEHGWWYEVDGPMGAGYVPADLVGKVTVTDPTGKKTVRFPTLEELQALDREDDEEVGESDSVRFPVPTALADYCENSEAWSVKLREGWGARLSAPGYLDCTEWTVFDTEEEAEQYLNDTYGDEEEQ